MNKLDGFIMDFYVNGMVPMVVPGRQKKTDMVLLVQVNYEVLTNNKAFNNAYKGQHSCYEVLALTEETLSAGHPSYLPPQ